MKQFFTFSQLSYLQNLFYFGLILDRNVLGTGVYDVCIVLFGVNIVGVQPVC